MTYTELISQFEVFENPPKKDGFHRHHIVPVSEQKEPDNRQVYLTWAQHFWAHILYDREHNTKTADWFLKYSGKTADFFDCFEKCLAYTYTFGKKMEIRNQKISKSLSGRTLTEEHRRKVSENHADISGKNHPNYGKHLLEETCRKISESLRGNHHSEETRRKMSKSHKDNYWWNNGIVCKRSKTCPGEGFVLGRLSYKKPRLSQNV